MQNSSSNSSNSSNDGKGSNNIINGGGELRVSWKR